MRSEEKQTPKEVPVPQYEEYRTAGWLSVLCQWLGGIGLAGLGVLRLAWPELLAEWGGCTWLAGALFLWLFGIPAIRSGLRSRENQRISRRNRRKYDQYRSALEQEQEKK